MTRSSKFFRRLLIIAHQVRCSFLFLQGSQVPRLAIRPKHCTFQHLTAMVNGPRRTVQYMPCTVGDVDASMFSVAQQANELQSTTLNWVKSTWFCDAATKQKVQPSSEINILKRPWISRLQSTTFNFFFLFIISISIIIILCFSLAFFFFFVVFPCVLISCSVTTKDKLQSQCCVFHAIADKAKYLSSILSHRTIPAAGVGPAADWIEGKCSSNWCFHSLLFKKKKNQKGGGGVRSRTAAVMLCSDQIWTRGDDSLD